MALTKVSSSLVSDNAVTSGKIADGGIATADIADVAVTTAKIANNAILTQHIDDGQVTTAQLGADAVTADKIANDAISEEHLDITVITSLTAVTAATGDLLMVADVSDSNNLKKIPVSSILAGTHTGAVNTSGTISSGAITAPTGTAIGQATFSSNILQSNNTGNAGARIRLAVSSEGNPVYSFEDDTNTGMFTSGADTLNFTTGGTQRMRIASDGKVGIGMTANSGCLLNVNSHVRAENSAFLAGRENASLPAFAFHDDTDTGMFNVASNILAFSTAGAERARVLANGDIVLGNTIVNPASGFNSQRGFGYDNDTGIVEIATTANAQVLVLGKNHGTDGSLLDFRKQSTVVGSIGVVGGNNLYINGDTVGLGIGDDNLYPTNATGASTNGALDIGDSSAKFRNLHLSGTISSGGITSGSHLINASSSAFGSNSVQGFNTDFLVDTGQGYSRHNSYHTGGSNHQFIVNAAGSTTNTVALAIAKDANATFAGTVRANSWYKGAGNTNTLYSDASQGTIIQTPSNTNNNAGTFFIRDSLGSVHFSLNTNTNASSFLGGTVSITSNTPVLSFIESDQSNRQFQVGSFGGAYAVYDATNSQFRHVIDNSGNNIFNTGGTTADFQVKSDNNDTMLFVDGGTNRVGIGTGAPSAILHLEGNTNGYDTSPLIYFGSTSTANAAVRDWAIGPADSDYGNFHIFRGASTGALAVGTSQIVFTINSLGDVRFSTNVTGAALIKGVSGNQADRDNSGYPQYTFIGNEGTGMRRVSSNILAFDTSGAERVRILADGKVGIGTATPGHPLSVSAANAKIAAHSTADSQRIGFQAKYLDHSTLYGSFEYTTGDARLWIDNNFVGNNGVYSDIVFRNCNVGSNTLVERMTIKGSTGDVNIGGASNGGTPKVNFFHNDSLRAFIQATSAAGMLLDSDGKMTFNTNNAAKWHIQSSGHLTPNNQHSFDIGGTNAEVRNIYAQGISFASNANVSGMSSELLDDYEEGTWTPTSGVNLTVNSTCRYTKIGNHVTVTFDITFASNSNGNTAVIGSLPFSYTTYNSGFVGWQNTGSGVQFHVAGTSSSIYNSISNAAFNYSAVSGKRIIGTITGITG